MKKIIVPLVSIVLLFGCNFGNGPAEPISSEMKETQPAETALADNLFVTLSAEILCLPSNHPEATAEEIEILAKNILKNANVSEEAFNIYQLTIEADPASKQELSLAILGKMGEFCTIVEGGEEEIIEEDKDTEVSGESGNSEADCAKEGETYSKVFTDKYPENCCAGLTEWNSGMDTRKVENGECIETGMAAGSPIGTCLNCGNGICEEIENICNCPKDCS